MKIKPEDIKLVAEWVYPLLKWEESASGQVVGSNGEKRRFFSLKNPREIQAVTMKLEQENGWRVFPVKRSGQQHWRAENGKGGWDESPSLPRLLVGLVRGIVEGGKK